MRIRISKKGIVAASVAGAILVCGAVFSMVGNKSVKHVGVASVSDDNTPLADAVKDALDGEKTADGKTAAAVVAGASTIEKKEEVKKEVKEEKTEEKEDVKEEAQAPAQNQAAKTQTTQTQTKKTTNNSAAAKKGEVINEEVKITETPKPTKEAQPKTQYVEEYVGSDEDTEKAIKAQQKAAEEKVVEKTGGDQFVEGLEY